MKMTAVLMIHEDGARETSDLLEDQGKQADGASYNDKGYPLVEYYVDEAGRFIRYNGSINEKDWKEFLSKKGGG